MEKYDFKKIGKFLEKKRNEEGLSLEYLSLIGKYSISTLSRLEKGECPKSIDKAIKAYENYCSLLGLSLEEVHERIVLEEPDELKTRLEITEISIDLKQSLDDDIERLEQLEIYAPDSAYIAFLKAKAFFYSQQLEKAKAEAMKVLDLTEEKDEENLKSAAHNILANIYYHKHDIQSALTEIEKGIKSFKGTERIDVYYGLLSFKVILLEDSYEELEELTENIHRIQNMHIACLAHEFKARDELKRKKIEKAISSAIAGLKIAAKEQKFNQAFELWEVLGRIFEEKQDFDAAERIYKKALKLENKITDPHLLITIYNRLGCLAMKQNQFEQAEYYLKQALSFDYSGSRILETFIHHGELLIKQGKKNQAISVLEKGLDLAEKLKSKDQAQQLVSLILGCMEEDDPKHYYYLKKFYKLSQDMKFGRKFR